MTAISCSPSLLLAVAVAIVPGRALADAEEGAVHVEVGPALMRVEDMQDGGATDSLSGVRAGVRGSYGLTDRLAAEGTFTLLTGADARFTGQEVDGIDGTLEQNELALRLTTGVTARLGVGWIPTGTLQVGLQHRRLGGGALIDPQSGAAVRELETRGVTDLLVVAGLGLDRRFGARWVAGVSAQWVHAFSLDGNSFDAFELPVHVSYYFYPSMLGR